MIGGGRVGANMVNTPESAEAAAAADDLHRVVPDHG